ncbi:uncharacterized protein LOC128261789 [Drosophila gunungcola]|uniref:C2H2-type domain-containing protein n=1 Tax=Drosophila gunungcola TaxID=103775 RepID=A0A9P9YRU5_9MUSC|nr:uncharacterized protein LOC128261789 [Drosophila gunungcola]KAI8041911.1 hypothetical protein M5D96_003206 [Drosophila gunungcola]
MWSRHYNLRPQLRLPSVHEQVAMQCARNIVKVATELPQQLPRSPSGHVPVLVELRRSDEPTVHRYQVNVPPTGWPPEDPDRQGHHLQQLVLPGTLDALGLRLPPLERPPCPMHGCAILETTNAIELWSPNCVAAPIPSMMTQSSMHMVGGQIHPTDPIDVVTFSEPVAAGHATQTVREHFMATLYQQHLSPLTYSDIWVHEEPPRRHKGATPPRPQLGLDENNKYVASKETRPINGYKAAIKPPSNNQRMVAELCLNSNGEYVPNEQLQLQQYRSHTTSNGMRRDQDQHFQVQHPYEKQQEGRQKESSPKGLNGYKGDLCGYGYVAKEQGKPRKKCEQSLAYSDQEKVLRLRSQDQGDRWPRQGHGPVKTQARVAMIEPRVRQEAPVKDKPALPPVTEMPVPPVEVPPPPNYPRELQALLGWNYCALCHVVLRSARNAMDHYSSRGHERRIGCWLDRQCPSGHVAPVGADAEAMGVSLEALRYLRTARSVDYYCDLCDVKMTSVMHAQQHFFGRRHRLVASQRTRPSGNGFYEAGGGWVRTDANFLKCELCEVIITSESQMAMHMAGVRHRRRVHTVFAGRSREALGLGLGMGIAPLNYRHLYRLNANGSLAPLRPLDLQILQAIQPPPVKDPSAAYFCQPCNITMNHMKSVRQHEKGRMHRRNLHRMPCRPVLYE